VHSVGHFWQTFTENYCELLLFMEETSTYCECTWWKLTAASLFLSTSTRRKENDKLLMPETRDNYLSLLQAYIPKIELPIPGCDTRASNGRSMPDIR